MEKAATRIVTEADAAAPSPNVIVEKVATMTAEGDPEASNLFRKRNEEGPQSDPKGRPLPQNTSNELSARDIWAVSMYLPGMPEASLTANEKNLLSGLY